MDVKEAIQTRRAYRSLESVEITEELVKDLAESAQLTCSCFNNQPWRLVFAYEADVLEKLYGAMSKGNRWVQAASMIMAVFSQRELDCLIKGREYYLFDTGMATAFMILRATELGLVAHPIAGFKEDAVKEILGIPGEMRLITLLVVGKHSETISPLLSEKQVEGETGGKGEEATGAAAPGGIRLHESLYSITWMTDTRSIREVWL
jgi:nitroreductase